MPRPRQSHGRPGTQVFPKNWQAEHAAVIGTTFDCDIRIAPAGADPDWNPETNQTETGAGDPVYAGCATITAISDSDRTLQVVDEPTALRRYEVKVPVAVAGVDPDEHFVYVDSSPDTDLPGRVLAIESVKRGDRRFSRVLYATLAD